MKKKGGIKKKNVKLFAGSEIVYEDHEKKASHADLLTKRSDVLC